MLYQQLYSENNNRLSSNAAKATPPTPPDRRRRTNSRRCGWLWVTVLMHADSLPLAAPFAAASSSGMQPPTISSSTYETPRLQATLTNEMESRSVLPDAPEPVLAVKRTGRGDDRSRPWKGGEEEAGILSRLMFGYATPLMKEASKRRLDEQDAFTVSERRSMHQSVKSLSRIFQHLQEQELKKKRQEKSDNIGAGQKVSSSSVLLLTRALILHQRRMLWWTGLLRFLNTAVQAFPALLVSRLLKLVEAGEAQPPRKALMAALTLVGVLTLKMLTENQYFHNVVKCSTQLHGALAALIFDKSLKLPGGGSSLRHQEKNRQSEALGVGGVLNLMQSDTNIVESAALQFHTIWDAPLQIIMYTTLLFRTLGPSVFWGILVLLLTIPVNSFALSILNRLSTFENEAKDARTKRTAEAIINMKLLKLQGWENRFADDVRTHRKEELRRHVMRGLVRAVNSAFSNAVPALVLVVTLTAYVRTGRPVVASIIFTAISLFNQLRFPLFFYPMLIDSLANGRNAMRRISSFLNAEEVVPYVQKFPPFPDGSGSIEMRNGNFFWPGSSVSQGDKLVPALANVDLRINPGEVVAVVGSVGSGKSALIKGLLGELRPASTGGEDGALNVAGTPTVLSYGNVAYCSQEAWLPKGTLRDAILFGREYNEVRYRAAIRDAGLDKDFADDAEGADDKDTATRGVLTHLTDVGEGGSSLSGGQRARVALARALYSDDDTTVFLLDDCLAALDASVGATVFERMTARLRGSRAATVLVTNDPSIPPRCDRVILVGKGGETSTVPTIVDVGTYYELIRRGHNLQSFGSHHHESTEEETRGSFVEVQELKVDDHSSNKGLRVERETIRVVGGYEIPANCTDRPCHGDPECQVALECSPDYMAEQVVPVSPDIQETEAILSNVKWDWKNSTDSAFLALSAQSSPPLPAENSIIKISSADDTMSAGAVPLSTYRSYFRSVGNGFLVVAMVSSYLMVNAAQFFQQYTVAKWTEIGGTGMASVLGMQYLQSLIKAAGVVSIFLWLRSYLTLTVGVRASEFFHSKMLKSVFAAPMSFFDATPSGQLMSRFGREIETVDRGVPDSIGSVLFCFLQIFTSIGALAGVITPSMLLPLSVVSILYVKAMAAFRPAARDMKRAETRTRSPIYTHFSEALRGTDTIRSVPGAPKIWSSDHCSLSDSNLGVYYTVKAFDRWLSARLETLGNVVVLTSAIASVYLTRTGQLKSGSAGWGLTQALAITGLLTWAVRCLTDLETNMMSVMRVEELTDLNSEDQSSDKGAEKRKMPKEASSPGEALLALLPHAAPLSAAMAPLDSRALVESGWPWRGRLVFTNVSMRYNAASPLVLKGVDLTVPAGTTLGVVGRTGSGKSSLTLTLFRIVEIEAGGSIEIDGVDIRAVSLESLRQSLAIIPQDPVLFAGSVAYNLDATGLASDSDMWNALEAASPSLAAQFRSERGLETYISEGGKNLSLGQRQLICLARALIRKSRVLVMDEATSSVDATTDREVQETVRREFVNRGVTVITVAHRLETVLGYDKIAVLGEGRLLEYGSSAELLRKPGGELRRLVEADRRNKQKGFRPSRDGAASVAVA